MSRRLVEDLVFVDDYGGEGDPSPVLRLCHDDCVMTWENFLPAHEALPEAERLERLVRDALDEAFEKQREEHLRVLRHHRDMRIESDPVYQALNQAMQDIAEED